MVAQRTVPEEEKVRERSILVGFQINGDARQLLAWALANIAQQGDRLMAVNVSRNHQDASRSKTPSLLKLLDDFMAEHEDLCAKKKVILAGRVAIGNSIKRNLVEEAELCAAKSVVVGANKNYSFGGSSSLAKYCARKLPSTVSLIAVHKGEVIFERAATKLKPISGEQPKPTLRSLLHPSIGMDAKRDSPNSSQRLANEGKKDMMKESKDYCIINTMKESKDYCIINYDKARQRRRKLPEPKPGWPLLRREVAVNIEASKDCEERKISVVQWVMKLPNRTFSPIPSQAVLAKDLEAILAKNSSSCKFFQYEELQISTNYFSPENLIGKGGNSQVYSGSLPNGQQVAIKVSKFSNESSKDFLIEFDIITGLPHERIVPLIGICVEDNNLIPVYSYFPRGSLEENLHGKSAGTALDWDKRFKVAVDVAEALSFLHCGSSIPVIHRDVKSSNILLTDEFNAKLSDFGLAIWSPGISTHLTNDDVVGTFGYLAPEYFMYGRVSTKMDVYAFGVVLLELLTGRKPINDEGPKGQQSLVMWAAPMLERGEFMELLDPDLLDGKYDEHQMKRMVWAASLCIRRAARHRPQANQILELLRGELEIEPWMNSSVIINNVADQDCEDEEAYPASSIGSHMGLALLDVDDDASVASFEQNYLNSLDEYLQDRWSRSSSFD